jgi:hypothetical protein
MPTGYTAGILEGKIKSFKQFATICMRAFGATIHMRDDSLTEEYKPRTPNGYYTEALEQAKEKLENAKNVSDSEIIKNLKKTLLEDQKRHEKSISEKIKDKEKLTSILSDVRKWEPPTEEHREFKNFMKQQLVDTISHNADTSYYEKELNDVQNELLKIQDKTKHQEIAEEYRKKLIEDAEHDIEYYTKQFNEEIERCNDSNKWVQDLINSIK